ncbi:uncharacterized protein ASCRUDRAFT_109657 [Ascoidea rubescens DSM 1968]|uniref:PCI domain-containing protein n=1 Tax=Ascoidea rubescens DSM 1968 TaxID=1344418 RepID=A0A1D2VD60_9ASCO|nr:hypothetical protein ASCRUDRAFT_109657 [Ascoidea rubescens DSM 1968]ODV59576.1 hypothetical protein ASCRUDRAFT_109657 [Ascoidea rubescens DSM 1968]
MENVLETISLSSSPHQLKSQIISLLEDSRTFNFNVLRINPILQAKLTTDNKNSNNSLKYLKTLELFSFGAFEDYFYNIDYQNSEFIQLSFNAINKLKALTVLRRLVHINSNRVKYNQLTGRSSQQDFDYAELERHLIYLKFQKLVDLKIDSFNQEIKVNKIFYKEDINYNQNFPHTDCNPQPASMDDLIKRLIVFKQNVLTLSTSLSC